MQKSTQRSILEIVGWWLLLVTSAPAAYLLWVGVMALVRIDASTDAWLQAIANIFGSLVSGGVAAFVAFQLFHRERLSEERELRSQRMLTERSIQIALVQLSRSILDLARRTTECLLRQDDLGPDNQGNVRSALRKAAGDRIAAIRALKPLAVLSSQVTEFRPDLLIEIDEIERRTDMVCRAFEAEIADNMEDLADRHGGVEDMIVHVSKYISQTFGMIETVLERLPSRKGQWSIEKAEMIDCTKEMYGWAKRSQSQSMAILKHMGHWDEDHE